MPFSQLQVALAIPARALAVAAGAAMVAGCVMPDGRPLISGLPQFPSAPAAPPAHIAGTPSRYAASLQVLRQPDGRVGIAYRQADGTVRVSTTPPEVADVEIVDSRHIASRSEWAAVARLRYRGQTECGPNAVVERLILSSPSSSNIGGTGSCGERVLLGMRDDGGAIGVQLQNGQWRQVDGARLVQPGQGATLAVPAYRPPTADETLRRLPQQRPETMGDATTRSRAASPSAVQGTPTRQQPAVTQRQEAQTVPLGSLPGGPAPAPASGSSGTASFGL